MVAVCLLFEWITLFLCRLISTLKCQNADLHEESVDMLKALPVYTPTITKFSHHLVKTIESHNLDRYQRHVNKHICITAQSPHQPHQQTHPHHSTITSPTLSTNTSASQHNHLTNLINKHICITARSPHHKQHTADLKYRPSRLGLSSHCLQIFYKYIQLSAGFSPVLVCSIILSIISFSNSTLAHFCLV